MTFKKTTLNPEHTKKIKLDVTHVGRLGARALVWLERLFKWLQNQRRGEKIVLLVLVVIIPVLVFYNLSLNPRPWHDEGAALLLARTLAEDGVYAMRNSDGYQTFGPVQSVGPTVILPVALVYRYFGVGLLQGRVVSAVYTLLALLLFFVVGQRLFDSMTAILGLFFLLAAPAVRILIYGREVLGEVPGLAIFLAGFLLLSIALQRHRWYWTLFAGLIFGATTLTKSQYLLMVPATLGLLMILDLFYYRLGAWKTLVLVTVIALVCAFAWQVWQMRYFGQAMYQEDLAKLRQLASITTGFHLSTAINGIRAILGSDSGNFYLYWGFPAMGYLFFLATQRTLRGFLLATIVIFTSLWLLYFMFWIVSWHHYALPAMALVALAVANLYTKLARAIIPVIKYELRGLPARNGQPSMVILAFGVMVGLFSYGMWAGYHLQEYVRSDVLDRTGSQATDLRSPSQLQYPGIVARYLEQNIAPGAVIETWERELGILTDLTYHTPDQSMLTYTHNALYRGSQENYLLGEDYLKKAKADYIILGWFARSFPIYDMAYLERHSVLIKSIGDGNYNYEIYRLNH
jgi:4-amino-4-deoxy-L-arabinose transferase-like glycosyltransferase